jgi:hypothetical protein
MAKRIRRREVATASFEEARQFTQALQETFRGRKRTSKEKERLREYLGRFDAEYLRSIARRLMIEVMKGPGQPRPTDYEAPPPPPPPPRGGRGTAAPTGEAGAKPTRRGRGRRPAKARKPRAARRRS